MMDPMLMAIIAAVVVVILAGVFFMKSRNKGEAATPTTTPTKSTNRPKTLAEQQRELEARSVMPAAVTPEVDNLTIAQQYFDQKDYSQAVTTLKSAIGKQPNRADLQLLLLKTYAEQKNYTDFDTAYSNLSALNDPAATAQASTLKRLLDEEQSQAFGISNTAVPVAAAATMAAAITPAAATVPDSMDFDDFSLETDTLPTAQSAPSTVSSSAQDSISLDNDSFSFDDLESQVLTTSQSAVSPAPSATLEDSSFDLDFDIDTPATAATAPVTTADTALAFDDFDMDLSLDNSAAASTTPQATTATTAMPTSEPSLELENFGFDEVDLTTNDTATAVSPSVSSPKEEPVAELEEFNFDFNDTTATSAHPSHPVESTAVDATTQEHLSEHTITETYSLSSPTESLVQDTSLDAASTSDSIADFEDFDLTFDELASSKTNTPVNSDAPAATLLADEPDFTFDFDDTTHTAAQASDPQLALAAQQNPQNQSDAFTLDTPVSHPAEEVKFNNSAEFDSALLTTPTTQSSTENAGTDLSHTDFAESNTLAQLDALYAPTATPDMPVVSEPTPSAPAIPSDSPVLTDAGELGSAFAFIKDIDTTQLNLDLAEQYIELGEYDSAKRLLNEISNANPTQQSMVTHLLDKIG